jgi:hypothetical protein
VRVGLSKFNDKLRPFFYLLLPLFLISVIASPIFGAAIRSDDIANIAIANDLKDRQESFFPLFMQQNSFWMTERGRFFPASILATHLVFQNIEGEFHYFVFLFCLILLSAFMLYVLVIKFSKSALTAMMAVFIYAPLIQFRPWYDGLASFNGQQLIALNLGLLGIILFPFENLDFLKLRFTFSLILVLLSTFTYEWGITFLLFFVFLAFRSAVLERLGLLPRVAAVFSLSLYILFVLNLRSKVSGPTYNVETSVLDTLEVLLRQITSMLPLSQWWLPGVMPVQLDFRYSHLMIYVLCSLIIFFLLTFFRKNYLKEIFYAGNSLHYLGMLGLGLIFLPALTVAVHSGWIDLLPSNQGYVPVVAQSMGLSLLITAALFSTSLQGLREKFKWLDMALAILILTWSMFAFLTLVSNFSVALSRNW